MLQDESTLLTAGVAEPLSDSAPEPLSPCAVVECENSKETGTENQVRGISY